MTITADIVTPVVDAAPGEPAYGTVRLHNRGSTPATVHLRTVGLDVATTGNGQHPSAPVAVTIQPGQASDVPVAIEVPATLGIGDHAAAFEVVSQRPGDRPLLVPFTVSIASVERVELTPYPSTIRGRRRASFRLDVVNHEDTPVDVAIEGSAPEVQVSFAQPRMHLVPGQHAVTKGRVKGPRRWTGEPTQHTVLITARGRASSTSVTAAYVQRPMFAAKLRMITAALVVIALWAGAVGGFALWWANRDDGSDDTARGQIEGVDTDGDGVVDTFFDENGNVVYGVDTDGDGEPDQFFDADGNPVPDPRSGGGGDGGDGGGGGGGSGEGGGDDAASGPRSTVVRGTVSADDDITDVSITMTPITLGQPAQRNGIMGFAGGPAPATTSDGEGDDGEIAKIWSARYAPPDTGTLNPVRQTEPVRPLQTNPEANGLWMFTDVALRQTYQLVFSKPGYESQSFVITPPDDGSAVELEVEMKAAVGAISGRVFGPSGPLGGVAITVTDGTLTFETTSATVGEVGSWSVEGLSTPAVYTVVGELRGYGTEVLQVRLDAGQTLGSANLNMRPGVGSISGRIVGTGGEPLGGVTVTATNGEVSRTTSSLTEGNIGFFNIPQLDIPGTYTVTVTHEGYIGQTRRLPVNGAVGGVDFTLLRTTLRLTGLVTSSDGGRGVPNAGLTLSNGELAFKVQTAAAPIPGTFVVDDLPPGNYTVTIEHYQHETTTEFVTLAAGVTPPPLNVTLKRLGDAPPIGTGTLVVEVVDNAADSADRREIKDATVRLVRIRDNKELPPITQHAFNFRIPNLEIGTYLLYVTAPKYNPAPPRRVSIGLSETRVEVSLQRLGQAIGRLVDRTDPDKVFDRYFVEIYRADDPPGARSLLRLPSRSDGTWQTLPDSMVPGAYRIRIEDPDTPPGYTVHHNQLLDPEAPGATPSEKWMVFVIPEGAFDPVVVPDIYADPYPEITGRVFRSSLVSASGFTEVDDPDLKVTLSCPGGTTVEATLLDEAGLIGGPDDPPRYETFRITKEDIDANNLTGNCELTAQAPAPLLPVTMSLPGVDAGQSTTPPDRRVSLALPVAPPSVGGRVFWRDGTTPVYLQGVNVSAQPVTGYGPIDGTSDITQVPNRLTSALTTTTDVDGAWELTGQIAGTTDYRFTADNFAQAIVPFTVDPDGVLSHGVPENAVVTPTAGGRYDVELSDPDPGAGRGQIRIRTIKPNPAFGDVGITATSPAGTVYTEAAANSPIERDATPSGDRLGFSLVDIAPGTWTVEFTAPDNHAFFEGPPAGSTCAVVQPSRVCQRVLPGLTRDGFDASLVELGRLELTLLDSSGLPLAVGADDVHISLTGGSHTGVQAGGSANEFVIEGIQVDATDPVNLARCYVLSVTVDGYDAPNAAVDGPAAAGCAATGPGSLGIPVAMLAGSELSYEIELPQYGTIQGSVVGQVGSATEDIPLTSDNITVTPLFPVDSELIEVTLVDNEFVVSGPPGQYEITIEHPNFEDTPVVIPADGIDPDPDSLPPGVFRLENEVDNELDPFVLAIRTGRLDIFVVDTLETGDPVDGAVYCLSGISSYISGVSHHAQIGPSGTVSVGDLVPGAYRLQLRMFLDPTVDDCSQDLDPSQQTAFPTITTVVIGRGTADTPAVTTVRAPLPEMAQSLSGAILAVNADDKPVPLPDDPELYEVILTFERPNVEQTRVGDPAPTPMPIGPGDFLDDDCVADPDDPTLAVCTADIDVSAAASGRVEYEFQYLPFGEVDVSLSDDTVDELAALGYTLSGSTERDAVIAAPDDNAGPNYEFSVANVRLEITLAPEDHLVELTTNSVVLDHPELTTPITTYDFDADTNTLIFHDVAPRIGPYELQAAATLHVPLDVDDIDVPVTPGPDPVVQLDRFMTGNLARVTGTARLCNGTTPATCGDLGAGSTIQLLDDPAATTPVRQVTGVSSFLWDVEPDEYWIKVSQNGYVDEVVPVDLSDAAGTATTVPQITINKLATVDVTIANGGTLSGLTINLRSVGASPTTYAPTSAPDPDDPPPTAKFAVPAGDYDVVVSAGSNYPETVIDVANSVLAVGADVDWTVYLARKLDVSVSGTGTTDVTVSVFQQGANLATATPLATATHTAATAFSFSWPYTLPTPPTWFIQPLVVQVTANGYRTQVVNTSTALYQALPVSMSPHVEVSGTIISNETPTDESGTGLVRATSPGVAAVTGNVVDGVFTLSGLTNNLVTGAPRTWTVTYDKPGVGTSAGVAVVVSASNTVASFDLTAVPQKVEVRFVVTDQDGGAVTGATVTAGGASAAEQLPDVPGTYVIELNETFATVNWSAAKTNHVGASGTVPNLTSRPAGGVSIPVSLPSRMVNVTVVASGTGNPPITDGISWAICELNNGGNCSGTPGAVPGGVTHAGNGVYRFVAPNTAGDYRLHISRSGYQDATRDFEVPANGAVPDPRSFTVTMTALPSPPDDD